MVLDMSSHTDEESSSYLHDQTCKYQESSCLHGKEHHLPVPNAEAGTGTPPAYDIDIVDGRGCCAALSMPDPREVGYICVAADVEAVETHGLVKCGNLRCS